MRPVGKMQKILLLPLLLISLMNGQDSVDQGLFKITEGHYRLGKYEIVIRQQKRIKQLSNQKQFDTHVGPVWCSAFVEIREDDRVIDKIDFNDIWPLGGNFGIHLPLKQESPKHFILMKYGDYDCRTLIITDEGKVFNLGGGSYRIFQNRYLISPRELPDALEEVFSIFDLRRNNVLATLGWSDLAKDLPPIPVNNTVYIIKFYTNGFELFAGIVLMDMHRWQAIQHPVCFYRIDLETGKTIQSVFDEKKHAEFVIDYSNLDLSNDCECKNTVGKGTLAE
jgi:hypothetical protein